MSRSDVGRWGGRLLTILALTTLSSCLSAVVTVVDAQRAIDAEAAVGKWVGHDIHELIVAQGKPTISLPSGDRRTYEWRWGKPERFEHQPDTSMNIWLDHEATRTDEGTVIADIITWKAECKEAFEVDFTGKIVAARAKGLCPPQPDMIPEGTTQGTDALGVGEL